MHRRRQRRKRMEAKAAALPPPSPAQHPAAAAAAEPSPRALEKSASDTPLLRYNNNDSGQMQALSLESPRILVNMPPSTRSNKDSQAAAILSTDDARQIGDIFRDALRKPPASEDEMEDDQLEDDDDPGWRERVASERMQRELQQEASVLRSVAMRAHGSDYTLSRPDTPLSDSQS
ncbi:hypothetical protein GGI21_002238 [Coemansia aciculifera]|nr:hypothetical protein GGI21_002238 [Coemansia aciculifera]